MAGITFAPVVDRTSADTEGPTMSGVYGPRPRLRGRFHQVGAIASWSGALIGVGLKLTQLTVERDPCPWLVPIMAWLPLMAIPWLAATSGLKGVALLLTATAIYALGGICFAKKNPDPAPTVFGYHEIFHICTLAAGTCQFLLTVQLVSN